MVENWLGGGRKKCEAFQITSARGLTITEKSKSTVMIKIQRNVEWKDL